MNPIDLFLSNWRKRPVTLVSPLSPKACAERLRETTDNTFAIMGAKPVRGSVYDTQARLNVKPGFWRNGFRTVLVCDFVDSGTGTRLDCRSSGGLVPQIFMSFWFLFTAAALVSYVALQMRTDAIGIVVWIMPLLMALMGFVLTCVGRWMARDEHDRLVAFLEQTLDAKVRPGG